jgi:hypothetical protein
VADLRIRGGELSGFATTVFVCLCTVIQLEEEWSVRINGNPLPGIIET